MSCGCEQKTPVAAPVIDHTVRRCSCNRPDCPLCLIWRFHNEKGYAQRLMDRAAGKECAPPFIWPSQKLKPLLVLPKCVHQGEKIGEWQCPPCGGNVRLSVFSCAKHGECTLAKESPQRACCLHCDDHSNYWVRNLIYHLYPMKGKWQWHSVWLKPRLPLFNGRRLMAIVVDNRTDDPEMVKQAFGDDFEYIIKPNNPDRWEVETFPDLFGRVETSDPHHVTLYAHGKGIKWRAGDASIRWAQIMYETYMDYWPLVERLFGRYPVCGSFKVLGAAWPSHESTADWHYSGSWAWFRNRDLFKGYWYKIDQFWCGIESYWGLHFPKEDAGVIFMKAILGELNYTSWENVNNLVQPNYDGWRIANAHNRRPAFPEIRRPA